MHFEGEYLNNKIWNGKGYNTEGQFQFELKNGCGYVKEYNDNDQIIFEGEYLNGERWSGNAKKYVLGRLTEEEEYFNGKKFGKIKSYNLDGKLIFEGKKNGKGKEYYSNGKLKFEGEYLNDSIWDGIGYNENGNKEFEIKDGKGNIKEYNNYG